MEEDLNGMCTHIEEVKEYIANISVKKKPAKKVDYTEKILTFTYSELIKFESVCKNKGTPMSRNFIDKKCIINNKIHIHHSDICNEVIGYARSFCSERVRENKTKTTAVAHNLFRFDFFSTKKIKSWCLENNRHLHRRKKSNKYKFCEHRQSGNVL